MPEQLPLSDQLRRAILNADVSRYVISRETGVNESALCQFCAGRRGLGLDSIDKVCAFLGISLNVPKRPKKKE